MSSFNWSPFQSSGTGVPVYANLAAFPTAATAGNGSLAIAADTNILYESNGTSWLAIGGPTAVLSLGTFGSSPNASGASIASNTLTLQPASATQPGGVSTVTQSFAGDKTFTGAIAASNLSGTNTGDVTLGTANGLILVAQALSLALSSTSTTGALSSTDWNTFNGKQSTVTIGALDAQAANANGLALVSNVLSAQSADATHPGMVNLAAQTFAGTKQFNAAIYAAGGVDLASSGTLAIGTSANSNIINIGNSGATVNINGTVLYENVTQLQVTDPLITVNHGGGAGSASNSGIEIEENAIITAYAETSADRNSWILKAPNTAGIATITPGVSGITLDQSSHNPVTIGTASGLSLSTQALSLALSSTSTVGALSAADWNTFNGKQTAGNYLTALTGDATASGPGSAALTLATVNGNVGTFGSTTQAVQVTVNAKGLITAISNQTIAPSTPTAPTVQKFLSGSGNYTTPAGVLYLRVVARGAGGGGAASGTTAGGAAADGTATTFGSSLITANGGIKGVASAWTGGAGGTATLGGTAVGESRTGAQGMGGSLNVAGVIVYIAGGRGGGWGGGGAGGANTAGGNGAANSGGGGTGGGGIPTANSQSGDGGGEGGYIDALVYPTAAQVFAYVVGAGGAGGTAGVGGVAGGNGADGEIVVYEYRQ